MSLEEDILIEKFLRGELSEKEHAKFLNRLENDPLFHEKVTLESQLSSFLDDNDWYSLQNENPAEVKAYEEIIASDEITELKAILKDINAKQQKANTTKRINWPLYASAALIALIVSLYLIMRPSVTSEKLYSEYISLSDLPSLVVRSTTTNTDLIEAQKLFEAKNYSEALYIFRKNIDQKNSTVLLYKGISEMQLDKFQEAENTFKALSNSDYIDAEKGYWYRALLNLKRDSIKQVKTLLHTITSNKYYNSNKALELLKELK